MLIKRGVITASLTVVPGESKDPPKQGPLDKGDEQEPEHTEADKLPPLGAE